MKDAVILVTSPGLGTTSADDVSFGEEMLDKFLHTLESQSDKPMAICFYTEGVKVVAAGGPLALGLKLLNKLGIRLVACGSCLDYYGVDDVLDCVQRGTMPEIVKLIAASSKTITV